MKITPLNTTDTYKLVDKEGWFDNNITNEEIMFNIPTILTGFTLDFIVAGEGWVQDDVIIAEDEYEFFEIVENCTTTFTDTPVTPAAPTERSENTLWDGISPIEVGMIVKTKEGYNYIVNYVNKLGTKLSISEVVSDRLIILNIDECVAATQSEKEQTFEKVLSAWKGQGIGFAYDSKSSEASIGIVFDVVYNVMKGDGNE